MAAMAGLFSVTGGSAVAYLARRFPARAEAIEAMAGALLLGGFALIGCALPAMI